MRHSGLRATVLLGLCLAWSGLGCKDDNPFDADFGVEMQEPLTVSWGEDEEYHRSSGEPLRINARASSRVDWRVEITSNTGGKVIQDDFILQKAIAFTIALPFRENPQNTHLFSDGDSVTVRAIATPQIKPSQADRAVFHFVILP